MAHTSTTIYRNTSTTPNQGVCIADIQTVLGSGRNDIGGLITYGDINEWAKYKPTIIATLGLTGKTSGSQYWKAADFKCGFAFDVATEFGAPNSVSSSFAKSLYNGQLDWTYARPLGGISVSPFRFLDFDGYDHEAECPIGDLATTTVYLQLRDNVYHLMIDYDYNDPGTNDWLKLSDISVDGGTTYLSSYYLGILLYNGTNWMAVTSISPLGSDSGDSYSIDAEFPAAYAGQWDIVPFISRDAISITGSAVATGKYLSFYNKHRETITIAVGSVTIFAEASWVATRSVSWEVTIINNDGSSKSFSNPTVVIQRTNSPVSPSGGTQVGQASLSDFTVSGNSTATKSSDTLGAITPIEDYDQTKTYWVRFSCDQQGYISEWNQFDYDQPLEP